MNTLAPDQPKATSVEVRDDELIVCLEDGRAVHVPLEWFPRLRDAKPSERSTWRLVGGGIGIHWPEIDEDLSVKGLLVPLVDGRRKSA